MDDIWDFLTNNSPRLVCKEIHNNCSISQKPKSKVQVSASKNLNLKNLRSKTKIEIENACIKTPGSNTKPSDFLRIAHSSKSPLSTKSALKSEKKIQPGKKYIPILKTNRLNK